LILDGYLTNLEERKGRPARITFGDPLLSGGESAVLHHADALAGDRGGGGVLSPPSTVQPLNPESSR
jgi:hypothetical protein